MGSMKARWFMRCACCGKSIEVGSQFVTYASNPWIPQHLSRYKESRRQVMKA